MRTMLLCSLRKAALRMGCQGAALGSTTARSLSTDSHVTIVPYFTVPEGKMDDFAAGFPAF